MHDRALARFEALFGPEFGHGKPLALAPLRDALARLGAPQRKLAPVIHVAGTNGKGSTIAFLRAIAEAAGLRVHAFTKPHLFLLRERFVVAGETLTDEALIAAGERVAAQSSALTQFDAQVAAALLLFSENPADLVLLETGMGGRCDSTNVIDTPALAAITPIGLDHQDALGVTLTEIAGHKAGILKPHAPAIVARQHEAARNVIEARAAEIGASLLLQGIDWDAHAERARLIVQTASEALDLPLPSLAGAHQIDNAGLAAAALLHSRTPIARDAFATGVAHAHWPGRLQALTRGRFSAPIRTRGGEVWVDGGHNSHAAEALARELQTMKARRGGTNVAIIGLRARKEADAFVAKLAAGIDTVISTQLAEPHVEPARLASLARQEYGLAAQVAPSLSAAMQSAAKLLAPRVLICGSFSLVAEALDAESA